MARTECFKKIFQLFKDVVPVPNCGILTLGFLSCALFGIQTYFSFSQTLLSVGASVFQHGHIHTLLTYPFHHQSSTQLFINIVALAFLGGSMERAFGTVHFLCTVLLLSTTTGFVYSFLDVLQNGNGKHQAGGLLPVALACMTVTTMRTKMTKGFLCGFSFPTMALPWVLLIITSAFIPHSVLPCNIIAVLVGWMYGKGWFSLVDLSEARAGVLEKMMPFSFLRKISDDLFVPASTEDRRRTILPQINPVPGSYPIQAYAPLSSLNTSDNPAKTYEGWSNISDSSTTPLHNFNKHDSAHSFGPNYGQCSEQDFGHSLNHNHGQL